MNKSYRSLKSYKLKGNPKNWKICAQLLGFFVFMGLFLLPLAEANNFESALQDLGNKSRSKIKTAVVRLGDIGNPAATLGVG